MFLIKLLHMPFCAVGATKDKSMLAKLTGEQTNRQTGEETDRHANRRADRQSDNWTDVVVETPQLLLDALHKSVKT